ncbi:MAG: UDP-N-acetylmuramoyl-tripeptide--D-alanyl-D-alanine ligase, partial [Actinomycetota bacterium]|nr:UDP-N-acetylmuramoyl-tripeptide--D-alanyl-D-alanine ligase [Actinomycetota bacterium]
MKLTIKEIVDITGGQGIGDPSAVVNGVSIDSRLIDKNQLFVPIKAKRNGHDFVSDAIRNGATGHLFSEGKAQGNAVKVNDTLIALQDLAKFERKRITGDVIGITGSVGKTTTKDILFASLRNLTEVHVSKLSFNNELGLPLTILSAESSTKHLILEMGARGPGQIAELAKIATPTIGIVTRVASA